MLERRVGGRLATNCVVRRALERVERVGVTAGVAQHLRPAAAALCGLTPALRFVEPRDRTRERVGRAGDIVLEHEPFADGPPRASLLGDVVDAEELQRLPPVPDGVVATLTLERDASLLDAQHREV